MTLTDTISRIEGRGVKLPETTFTENPSMLPWYDGGERDSDFIDHLIRLLRASQVELLAALDEATAKLEHALSWEGLLEFVDEVYPSDTFTGESGDPGPRFIVLLRELKKAEADLAKSVALFDELTAIAREHEANAKMHGAANGELKDKLAEAEAELADYKSRPSQARAMEAEEKLAWAEAELAEFKALYQPAPVAALREELAALKARRWDCGIPSCASYPKAAR